MVCCVLVWVMGGVLALCNVCGAGLRHLSCSMMHMGPTTLHAWQQVTHTVSSYPGCMFNKLLATILLSNVDCTNHTYILCSQVIE